MLNNNPLPLRLCGANGLERQWFARVRSAFGRGRKAGCMISEFANDDRGYHKWLQAHPDGFVLNVRRDYAPKCVVLHSAKCANIRDRYGVRAFGASTGRAYRKVCSQSIPELAEWARAHGRSGEPFSKMCQRCLPEETRGAHWWRPDTVLVSIGMKMSYVKPCVLGYSVWPQSRPVHPAFDVISVGWRGRSSIQGRSENRRINSSWPQ
jgi:hypothetical protein